MVEEGVLENPKVDAVVSALTFFQTWPWGKWGSTKKKAWRPLTEWSLP